jgi:hypothetical protein
MAMIPLELAKLSELLLEKYMEFSRYKKLEGSELIYSEPLSPRGFLRLDILMEPLEPGDVALYGEVCVELYIYKFILKNLLEENRSKLETFDMLKEFVDSLYKLFIIAGRFKLESPYELLGKDIIECAIEGGSIGFSACGVYWPNGDTYESEIENLLKFVEEVRKIATRLSSPSKYPSDKRLKSILVYLADALANDLHRGLPVKEAGFRSLSSISHYLNISKSTAHRLLNILKANKYISHKRGWGYRICLDVAATYAHLYERNHEEVAKLILTMLWKNELKDCY